MLHTKENLDKIWDQSQEGFGIQQIKEEWDWLIGQTVNQWDDVQNILEIGCYDGGSTYYLSKFAWNMVTIDNNDPCRFDIAKIRNNCDYYEYLAGDSHSPNQTDAFTKYKWKFAFIDGDHSYEGVKADFYNLLPHLEKGTPVAFHDIVISDFHHQHGCYVGEFWRDLKREYKASKFEEISTNKDWGGIGILFV